MANSDQKSRIGFMGPLLPQGSGPTSLGLISSLLERDWVDKVIVFATMDSKIPSSLDQSKLEIVRSWNVDDPITLVRSLLRMLNRAHEIDSYLFNTYLTMYGRSRIANALGLVIPSLLVLFTRKPIVVYMHNFLETQDISQLGYAPSSITRVGTRSLEYVLLKSTTVVVPLPSQREELTREFGLSPQAVPLPIEPYGLMLSMKEPLDFSRVGSPGPVRILLLGTWGPQKDLKGALEALQAARSQGSSFKVSVSGAVNMHFPEYLRELDELAASGKSEWISLLGFVPDSEVLQVIADHDLVLLPYNATGGFSGALSLAAFCHTAIIAYDLPQLRETAALVGARPIFVRGRDLNSVAKAVMDFCNEIEQFRVSRLRYRLPNAIDSLRTASEPLLTLLRVPQPSSVSKK